MEEDLLKNDVGLKWSNTGEVQYSTRKRDKNLGVLRFFSSNSIRILSSISNIRNSRAFNHLLFLFWINKREKMRKPQFHLFSVSHWLKAVWLTQTQSEVAHIKDVWNKYKKLKTQFILVSLLFFVHSKRVWKLPTRFF